MMRGAYTSGGTWGGGFVVRAKQTARSLTMADVLFVYWGNGLRLSYEPECMAGEAEGGSVTEKGDRHGVWVFRRPYTVDAHGYQGDVLIIAQNIG